MSLVCKLPPPKGLRESDKKDVVFWLCEAGLVGPIGSFSVIADVVALGSVWGGLFYTLASNRGLSIDKAQAIKICEAILLGSSSYYMGCKAATKFLNLIPGAGTLASIGISSFENIVFTYRFALAASQLLEMDEFKKDEWKKFGTVISSAFCGNDGTHSFIPINDTADVVKMMVNPKYNVQIRECAADLKDDIFECADRVSEAANNIGIKLVNKSTEIITSDGFKKFEEKVDDTKDSIADFASNAKDALVDFASNASDAYVDFVDDKIDKIKKWWRNL